MLISAPLPFTSGSGLKRTKKTHLQAQLAGALYELPLVFRLLVKFEPVISSFSSSKIATSWVLATYKTLSNSL